MLSQTGVTTNFFQFGGLWGAFTDPDTDRVYIRARIYLPGNGRWTVIDPAGFVDGMNLYLAHFVPNGMDPSGMQIDPLFYEASTPSYYTVNCKLILFKTIFNINPTKNISGICGTFNMNFTCTPSGAPIWQQELEAGGCKKGASLFDLSITASCSAEQRCGSAFTCEHQLPVFWLFQPTSYFLPVVSIGFRGPTCVKFMPVSCQTRLFGSVGFCECGPPRQPPPPELPQPVAPTDLAPVDPFAM